MNIFALKKIVKKLTIEIIEKSRLNSNVNVEYYYQKNGESIQFDKINLEEVKQFDDMCKYLQDMDKELNHWLNISILSMVNNRTIILITPSKRKRTSFDSIMTNNYQWIFNKSFQEEPEFSKIKLSLAYIIWRWITYSVLMSFIAYSILVDKIVHELLISLILALEIIFTAILLNYKKLPISLIFSDEYLKVRYFTILGFKTNTFDIKNLEYTIQTNHSFNNTYWILKIYNYREKIVEYKKINLAIDKYVENDLVFNMINQRLK